MALQLSRSYSIYGVFDRCCIADILRGCASKSYEIRSDMCRLTLRREHCSCPLDFTLDVKRSSCSVERTMFDLKLKISWSGLCEYDTDNETFLHETFDLGAHVVFTHICASVSNGWMSMSWLADSRDLMKLHRDLWDAKKRAEHLFDEVEEAIAFSYAIAQLVTACEACGTHEMAKKYLNNQILSELQKKYAEERRARVHEFAVEEARLAAEALDNQERLEEKANKNAREVYALPRFKRVEMMV